MKRLLPSCLLAGLGKYVLMQIGFVSHSSLNIFLLFTSIYLWYVYAILVYYILAPFLYKLLSKCAIASFIGVCILSLICNYIPFDDSDFYFIHKMGWVTERLPVFVLGMIYAICPINIGVKKTMTIGVAFYILCAVLHLGSIMVRFQWHIPHQNLLIQFAAPMLCILASYMYNLTDKLKLSKIVLFFGTFSLELYLWHEYIYWNMHDDERLSSINVYIQCIGAVGLSILLAYLTHLLAKYIQKILHSPRFLQ